MKQQIFSMCVGNGLPNPVIPAKAGIYAPTLPKTLFEKALDSRESGNDGGIPEWLNW